jgi:hypothetical protein
MTFYNFGALAQNKSYLPFSLQKKGSLTFVSYISHATTHPSFKLLLIKGPALFVNIASPLP